MKLEEAIGQKLAWLRNDRGMSQAQLGEALGRYSEKPWSRQAVNSAERGNRAFTARDLVALALALETSVPSLLLVFADDEGVELPNGETIGREAYRKLVFHPADIVGKTTMGSVEGVRRMRQLYAGLETWHKQLGDEIKSGATLLGYAEEVAEIQEEREADG